MVEIKNPRTQQPIDKGAERRKSLEIALQAIEKSFGKGSIMRLGDPKSIPVEVIPTGSLSLDIALGVGGLPRGRIIEIFGPESSGKTTIALTAIAEAQRMGGQAAFIDVEYALDPAYARILGVDVDNLLISQPSSGEEALDIMETLVRSNAVDIIVLDSVAALTTKQELEGDIGDATVGTQARLMAQAMRKLTPVVSRSGTVCVFINQLREKIGAAHYGPPEVTPGGRALKFFASIRIDIRKRESLKDGDEAPRGYFAEVKVVKNKVSPPFRKARFDIVFGKGLSKEGEILDMAEENKIVNKSGSWYSYGELRLGQGRENARDFLIENPDVFMEMLQKVKVKLNFQPPVYRKIEGSPITDENPVSNSKETPKSSEKGKTPERPAEKEKVMGRGK
ncbi:MAG: recombinase RecA [Candidatus Riflebacteria bacterium]|nr:recombinase RecA [Candidatus Riflebacteria bacterium]